MRNLFSRIATAVAMHSGHWYSFFAALLIVLIWAALGPAARFSDTWQLIINTGTTIITFLMVFLIQHTQNRDTLAIQLKLDELIKASEHASNYMLRLEDLDEATLQRLKDRRDAPA